MNGVNCKIGDEAGDGERRKNSITFSKGSELESFGTRIRSYELDFDTLIPMSRERS